MKKIIFFALALMALVGAGIGGYILLGSKGQEAHAKSEEKPAESEGGKSSGPPGFLKLDPIILPVIGTRNRVEQTVIVVVTLELKSEAVNDQLRPYKPRINDAYLRALYGKIGQDDVVQGQLIDIVTVKKRLTAATMEVLEPLGLKDAVTDVLVQNVTQRPAF